MTPEAQAPQPQLTNSSFSPQFPQLQLGIDSTSLGAFKTCPRLYQLRILEGWAPAPAPGWPEQWSPSLDLQFGIFLHEGRERYEDRRAEGQGHEEAEEDALAWLMARTWDSASGRPWTTGDGIKNRFTLMLTLSAYLDHYRDDPFRTLATSSGAPLIEHSFRFGSGIRSRLTGEEFLLCGHLDKVGQMQDSYYLGDLKSTKSGLGEWYLETFTPDNQFSLYLLASETIFPFRTRGLILDACQVLGTLAPRFQRWVIKRSPWELDRWLAATRRWLGWLEDCVERLAGAGVDFPQNDKACFRCDFRKVCSKASPAGQAEELARNFRKKLWDPLQPRRQEV